MKFHKERWIVAAGTVLALLAALGSFGPMIAPRFGVGGFAAVERFEQIRPFLLVVGIGLFGLAWYLIYRRPGSVGEGGVIPAGGKWAKIVFWSGNVLAFPAASFSWLVASGRISVACDACCEQGGTTIALQPWQPVDKVFAACAGACGMKAAGESDKVAVQPGVTLDQMTYCPVSGVVFAVNKSSPQRTFGAAPLHFWCEGCAAYFTQNTERVASARGLSLPKS